MSTSTKYSSWFGRPEGTKSIMKGTTEECLIHLWNESKSNGQLLETVQEMMDFIEIPDSTARHYLFGKRRSIGIRRIRVQSFLDREGYDVVEFRHFALLREALVFNKITLEEVGRALDLHNDKAVIGFLESEMDYESRTDVKILIDELEEAEYREYMSIDDIAAGDYIDSRTLTDGDEITPEVS